MPRSPQEPAVRQPQQFTRSELATLRAHGVVLFAGRVIFDAQPPMSRRQMRQIRRHCAGPLPRELRSLWKLTAGGQLDYDLMVPLFAFQEGVGPVKRLEGVSWVELFYSGSDHYRDLQGWIDYELETIAESSDLVPDRDGRTRLVHLPIGGFSYAERIYIGVMRGRENGWVLASKEIFAAVNVLIEGIGPVAGSLVSAMRTLCLERDPLTPVSEYFTGMSLFEYLDEREEQGLEPGLRTKLVDYYRRAVLDWETPLAAGTLGTEPELAAVALRHAVDVDDPRLVDRLIDAGVPLDAQLLGSSAAIEVAVRSRSYAAAGALVRRGAAIPPDILASADGAIPPELTAALLAAGADPLVEAMVSCVAHGSEGSARLIADAAAAHGLSVGVPYAAARDAEVAELNDQLSKVLDPSGHYSHYLDADGLGEHIERLRTWSP